jgi:hypothetical protein
MQKHQITKQTANNTGAAGQDDQTRKNCIHPFLAQCLQYILRVQQRYFTYRRVILDFSKENEVR